MLDLDKLHSYIEPVREAIGGKADSSLNDQRIAALSPERFVELWSQWYLGTASWGRSFYALVHAVDEARTP